MGGGDFIAESCGVKAELGPGAENPLICWWGASRLLLGEVGGPGGGGGGGKGFGICSSSSF